ncbi:MAG: hypothetical protein ACRDZ9_02480 [Acidimicrobiales bacterium]
MLGAVLAVAVVVVGVLWYSAGRGGDDQPAGGGDAPAGGAGGGEPAPTPADFVTYQDPEGRFSISVPRDWKLLAEPDPFLVASPDNSQNSVLVRVQQIGQTIDPGNVDELKPFTQAALGPEVTVLAEQPVTLPSGLSGYYYLYTFADEEARVQGAHAHYFLFEGNRLHTLVFQALPAESFTEMASVFDQIVETYRAGTG